MNLLAGKHLDRMPYGCKPSLENYLCGCDISVGCIGAMVTRMDSFWQLFFACFIKAIRTYLARFFGVYFLEIYTAFKASLLQYIEELPKCSI